MLDQWSFKRYCEGVKDYLRDEWPDAWGHIFSDSDSIESRVRRQLLTHLLFDGFMKAANVPDCAANVVSQCRDFRDS